MASEDHALLLGSLLVLAMLATLMVATRRVDWWTLGGRAADAGARTA